MFLRIKPVLMHSEYMALQWVTQIRLFFRQGNTVNIDWLVFCHNTHSYRKVWMRVYCLRITAEIRVTRGGRSCCYCWSSSLHSILRVQCMLCLTSYSCAPFLTPSFMFSFLPFFLFCLCFILHVLSFFSLAFSQFLLSFLYSMHCQAVAVLPPMHTTAYTS